MTSKSRCSAAATSSTRFFVFIVRLLAYGLRQFTPRLFKSSYRLGLAFFIAVPGFHDVAFAVDDVTHRHGRCARGLVILKTDFFRGFGRVDDIGERCTVLAQHFQGDLLVVRQSKPRTTRPLSLYFV